MSTFPSKIKAYRSVGFCGVENPVPSFLSPYEYGQPYILKRLLVCLTHLNRSSNMERNRVLAFKNMQTNSYSSTVA